MEDPPAIRHDHQQLGRDGGEEGGDDNDDGGDGDDDDDGRYNLRDSETPGAWFLCRVKSHLPPATCEQTIEIASRNQALGERFFFLWSPSKFFCLFTGALPKFVKYKIPCTLAWNFLDARYCKGFKLRKFRGSS